MSSRSSSGGSDLKRSVAVLAAGVATFANMYSTQAVLPVLAQQFHVSPAATGLTVTAPLLATASIAPLIGAISDRLGRKKLILTAALLLVIPSIFTALSTSLDALIAWRFVQGLLLPFIFTVTIAYIGDETNGERTVKLAATYTSGTIIGGFSGRLITGFVTSAYGWRPALLAVAAITLAMAVIIAACLPREKNFRPVLGISRALKAFPKHLSNPRLLATNAVGFGVLFCLVSIFTFIDFRLAAAPYLFGPAALGAVFVVYLGGAVMSPLAARLAGRFGRRPVITVAAGVAVLGILLTVAAPLPLMVLGLLLVTSAVFVEQTLATAYIGVAAQEAKSTAVGLYVTVYYIGGSVGGIAPAPLFRDYGWPGVVATVCLVQVLMLGIALRFWSNVRSGTSPAVPAVALPVRPRA